MKHAKPLPVLDYLRECFLLDESKECLVWRVRPITHFSSEKTAKQTNTIQAGKPAGTINGRYRTVWVDQHPYLAHRIVWFLYHGNDLLDNEIDHRNHDTLDNRPSNLRICDRSKQMFHTKLSRANTSGIKGVCWHKNSRKWVAKIKVNKTVHHLGYFSDIAEAASVIRVFREQLHGDFAHHG